MASAEIQKQRERISDVYRTLRMVGIADNDIDHLQYHLQMESIDETILDFAADLRSAARTTIDSTGMQAEEYIQNCTIEATGALLPEALIGALALLGTT